MLQYQTFYLQNYKGIKERLTFSLVQKSKDPHCIIGNNESGKTTILQGIELISKLCEGEEIESEQRKRIKPKEDYFSDTIKLGASLICSKNIMITEPDLYDFSMGKNETEISFEFSYKFLKSKFSKSSKLVYIDGKELTDDDLIESVHNLMIKFAPDVIYYDDFKFAVPKAVRFLESGKTVNDETYLNSEENLHWQKIFDDILKGHDNEAESFQKDIVDLYISSSEDDDANVAHSRLSNMGQYLDEILKEWIENENSKIKEFHISKIQPKDDIDKEFQDYQITIKSGKSFYEMNERSKGLQWSFSFHTLTKIRQNRHGAGFIFLLDEPANNLHIQPQSKMLKHLNDLCNERSMVVYSTHSPELIGTNTKDYKNTFIARNDADELQTMSDIKLYKLSSDIKSVEIEDIEPILAKLSYETIKSLGGKGKADKRKNWKRVATNLKNGNGLAKLASVATIIDFITDIFS